MSLTGPLPRALYTPGHTDEPFSFVLNPAKSRAVFTRDALLIRGSGRTDFQNGDAGESWDFIVNLLFKLPDTTLVCPAHDYHGWTVSSIGEDRRFNPRAAGRTREQRIEIMRSLQLSDPGMMDVAVTTNLA